MYYARALRFLAIDAVSGRFWGYDPFAMAGYVAGPVHELGSLGFTLAGTLFAPALNPALALLAIEVLSLLALPLGVYLFTRMTGLSSPAPSVALFSMAAVWGRFGFSSVDVWSHGFLPFQVGIALSLVAAALLWAWISIPSRGRFAAVTVLLAVVPIIHPGIAIFTVVLAGSILVVRARDLSLAKWRWVGGALMVAVAVNAFWVLPFLRFRDWMVEVPYYTHMTLGGLWRRFGPLQPSPRGAVSALVNVIVVAAAIRGLIVLRRANPPMFSVFTITGAGLLLIGLAGSSLGPVAQWGPGRYLLCVETLLFILGGVGAAAAISAKDGLKSVAVLTLILGVAAVGLDVADVRTGRRAVKNQFPPEQAEVIRWLGTLDRNDGRTLIECEPGNEPHFLDLAPVLSGAHVLGGSNAGNFLKSRFTIFSRFFWNESGVVAGAHPNVFGERLDAIDEERFALHLRRYNVRRILAFSPEAKADLSRFTATLVPAAPVGGHDQWVVKAPGSWFLEGNGALEASYDVLRISGASPGRIVLSFHWIDTFRAMPDTRIFPVFLPDNPVAFVGIDNGGGSPQIDIKNAGL